jgi:zinc and cadmium transporter
VSLIGILAVSIKIEFLKKGMIYMIAFSAGALFGDSFIHLLPEVVSKSGFTLYISLYILSGIAFSFIIEKVIHWRHCHQPTTADHPHPFALMNLFGDGVHNFIDGLIVASAYMLDIQVGIATTIAVILHEIPQEISDFGVLVHGGFTKSKALLLNFATALAAILGAIIALMMKNYVEGIETFLVPFAAGGFIYIAGADLIPEIHKEVKVWKSLLQFITFVSGIGIMALLLLVEF